jgi:hypothetical protein
LLNVAIRQDLDSIGGDLLLEAPRLAAGRWVRAEHALEPTEKDQVQHQQDQCERSHRASL